jgi:pimeloyl-ACP methyl ester carboxylesterase
VADVAQAASQLPSPPVVIGHSLGGLVVQKYLEQYEAPGGVLIATMPVGGTLGVTLRVLFHDPVGFTKLNLIQDLYPVVSTPNRARWVLFADDTPQEKVNEYFKRLQSESYMAYFESIFMTLPRPKRVKAPILVMSGEHDNLFSPGEGERTAKAYNGRFELVPGVAHSLMLDTGWQTAADRMLTWLQEQGF